MLVAEVARAVSRSSLRGRRVLVSGSATPATSGSPFRGRLGIAIANELHLRGADVLLVHDDAALPVPDLVSHRVAGTAEEYHALLRAQAPGCFAAVYSAKNRFSIAVIRFAFSRVIVPW